MPACWAYLAPRKKSGLTEQMPVTPFETASCTAVGSDEGLVWSSMTIPSILCPFTPPMAFCRAIRALKPWAELENPLAAAPVRDESDLDQCRRRRCARFGHRDGRERY